MVLLKKSDKLLNALSQSWQTDVRAKIPQSPKTGESLCGYTFKGKGIWRSI
jgi:hypothetical protein